MRSSNYQEHHQFWVKAFNAGYVFFIVIAPAAGALLKADATDIADWAEWLVGPALTLKEHAVTLVIVAPIAAAISKYLATRLESRWLRSLVQAALNKFADHVFDGLDGDVHHHRATLFRRVVFHWRYWPWGGGRWPWSGWLIPVSRSGHTTQKSRSFFLAPDDADRAEGVAGKVWVRDDRIAIRDLPSLTRDSPDAIVAEYAKRTWTPEVWIRARLAQNGVLACAFCGFPVEVKGKKWGVLILDSRQADAQIAPDTDQELANFQMTAHVLGKLLERW